MDQEKPLDKPVKKYVLCRRVIDNHNEVVEAGPKAPSAIGIVDFHTFIRDNCLHPLELAQFLKINHDEIQKLVENGGWIELHAQENLRMLMSLAPVERRRALCGFLMRQEGSAGAFNNPKQITPPKRP